MTSLPGGVDAWAMLTATIEVTSGLALVLGFLTREFALLLVVFNVSAAAIGHPYWSIHGDANARWAQFIGFWKDIGLAGGALVLLARGAGRLSFDQMISRGEPNSSDDHRLPAARNSSST